MQHRRRLPLTALVTVGSVLAGVLAVGSATAAPITDVATASTADGAPVATRVAHDGTVGIAGARADRQSMTALLARSKPLDVRAEDPQITFIAGLPRDRTALDTAATRASSPKELAFRDFMTLAEAGKSYGASDGALKKLRAAAKKAGVSVRVDPSRLLARLTAPASVWQDLYGTKVRVTAPTGDSPFRVYSIVDGKRIAGAPKALKAVTTEWLATYAEYVASADAPGIASWQVQNLQALYASPGTPQPWPVNTGALPSDTCGQQALTGKQVFTPGQVRKAYGSAALATRGMKGADARITIISLGGGFDMADVEAAAKCFGYTQPKVEVALGTGVPTAFVNASTESHLDLITASSIAPEASSIRMVEAVNALMSYTDAFSLALDMDGKGTLSPDVVSLSYGECEPEFAAEAGDYVLLNDDILRMAALVGTSVVTAAGDHGSSPCGPKASLETGPLVLYPASSPWITNVGGTRLTLTAANTRAAETVWNDLPYVGGAAAPPPGPAGSGGPSAIFDRPWYQGGVTPVGPRTLPDVALLGAIRPGWAIYYGGTLYTVGGTSGGTPFLAANLALMAADQRKKGYPSLGFVNPWFYAAATAEKAPFYDVKVGGNAVQVVGCCSAYAGYDMASGLGVPDMSALYRTVPYPAG